MPAVEEPVNLMWDDYKRPDGTTLLPWARGKPMAWDVTVPDTLAEKTRESNLFNAVRKISVRFTYYLLYKSLSTFRQRLKTFLFQASFPDIIADPR